MTTLLVIGSSGLVGSRFVELSQKSPIRLVTPSHAALDILNEHSLAKAVQNYRPRVIINFSTIINTDETEKERGDTKGKAWQTNVVGVSNLVAACKASGSFLIQISTDAVFPGSEDYPGPYHEHALPASDGKGINWYGYTKVIAEQETKKLGKRGAIVRISHPFGNPHSEKDLIKKTIGDINTGHKLFTDQQFTPTFIDDLVLAVWIITKKEISGIFHVACTNIVSRYVFSQYIAKKLHIKKQLIPGTMKNFLAQKGRAVRSRLGGLHTSQTQEILGLSFHLWQDAIDEYVSGATCSK